MLAGGPDAEASAQDCFLRALDIARDRDAKAWELRAATSLARLFQARGRHAEAEKILRPACEWFTEGFDTADLLDARALLDAVSK
jgi:predicted ATPase